MKADEDLGNMMPNVVRGINNDLFANHARHDL
jgi:hypothetical protein